MVENEAENNDLSGRYSKATKNCVTVVQRNSGIKRIDVKSKEALPPFTPADLGYQVIKAPAPPKNTYNK